MQADTIPARTIVKVILVAVAVGAAIYFIFLVWYILFLLLVAAFLAVALAPAVNVLHRRHVPRWLAILAVYFMIVLGIFGVGLLIVPPVVSEVNDFADNLPGYIEDLRDNQTFRRYDEKYGVVDNLQAEAEKLPKRLGDAAGTLRDVTVGAFTRAIQFVTVLVLAFIMLLDGRRMVNFFYRQLSPGAEARARKVAGEIQRAIVGYVTGNLSISLMAGLVTYATLKLLDMPFAEPLAVLMAFVDLIPLVGATLGGIAIGIVAAVADFPTALIVWGIVFTVYQQIENHVIQPLVYGRTVRLHPLIVIVSILIGGTLLGVLGALLAIPAAAVVQILVRDWWTHRPVASGTGAPAVEGSADA